MFVDSACKAGFWVAQRFKRRDKPFPFMSRA